MPRLGAWREQLDALLASNEAKASRERLTLMRVFEALRGLGYTGGYDAVRRYARGWGRSRAATTSDAFVPLSFAPGEAYQFDWSHEVVLIGGEPGIGKTRLVREMVSSLPDDIPVFSALAEPGSLGRAFDVARQLAPPDADDPVASALGIVSDAGAALEAFTRRAPKAIERDWTAAHAAYLRFSEVPESRSRAGVDPAEVVGALRRVLPADAVLANDAGNFSVFLHRYWRHDHPRTQVAAANGAMGYGVPGAVGAKLASPDSTVVALCGDGGFLMTGQEIETAVRYAVGITVVVFRNGMHGTIAMHQARDVGRTAGSEIGPVDLAGFVRSLGAEGFTVAHPADLEGTLREAVAHEGVSLVDVVTDPDLISPTARLSELAPEGNV